MWFFKYFLLISLGLMSTFSLANKPNIVYVIVDDLGWKDVGFHGGVPLTPNIDQLAKEGALLERFYTLPFSTSTRAAVLTGRYPMRYGLQMLSILPWNSYGIPADERLLPGALSEIGYETAAFGEWRLGHANKVFWPTQKGFKYFYGSLNKGLNHFKTLENYNTDWWENENRITVSGYDSEIITDRVVEFIENREEEKPFFLYIAYPNPASPNEVPSRYLEAYSDIENKEQKKYYGMVSALDSAVGKVVDALKKEEILENTLIVFHSDNGGAVKNKYLTGDNDVKDAVANNGLLFNGKGSLYEGGIRVPAIFYWKGKIKPLMTNELTHVTDMYATLMQIAGASMLASDQVKPADGVSIWNMLSSGGSSPRDEILVNTNEFRGALIVNNWKLIVHGALPRRVELYDIRDDPTEEVNRVRSEPDIKDKMMKRFNDYSWEMTPSLYLKDLAHPHSVKAPIFWRDNPTRP